MRVEVIPQSSHATRAKLDRSERRVKPRHRLRIGGGDQQEPALALPGVVALLDLRELAAHRAHRTGERDDVGSRLIDLEVAEDLLAVEDIVRPRQPRSEDRAELVLLVAPDDPRDDLVQVEVTEVRRLAPLHNQPRILRGENALKRRFAHGLYGR